MVWCGVVWCGTVQPSAVAAATASSVFVDPHLPPCLLAHWPLCAGPQDCHAVVLWFDTHFSERFCCEHPVQLSTSPCGPQTHWAQTVLTLKQPVAMVPSAAAATAAPTAAVALAGEISLCRSRSTHRSLDIVLRYTAQYADGSAGEEHVVIYGMGVGGN